MRTKSSYAKLAEENKKLVKEVSQLAIKNVELEKKSAFVEFLKNSIHDDCMSCMKEVDKLNAINSTLSDNATHFKCERAELALALVEISNCKDLELAKEIAKSALSQVHTVVKLKDTNPF